MKRLSEVVLAVVFMGLVSIVAVERVKEVDAPKVSVTQKR